MAVQSTMLDLGSEAPHFALPSVKGDKVSLGDFEDAPALVVAFLCNHCPYVRHVEEELGSLAREYARRDVAFVGICSNDTENFPDDGPAGLAEQKARAGFTFPYLIDEEQDVALAYRAACTPDFFVFDGNRRLVYRGRMDESRPDSGVPVTGEDLRAALDAVLSGEPVSEEQFPSMGCSIKFRQENTPDYLTG